MGANQKQVYNYLFAAQGVGVILTAVFLVAYLSGLPTTAVLHSEPIFRTTLTALGLVFLGLILATIILAIYFKKLENT